MYIGYMYSYINTCPLYDRHTGLPEPLTKRGGSENRQSYPKFQVFFLNNLLTIIFTVCTCSLSISCSEKRSMYHIKYRTPFAELLALRPHHHINKLNIQGVKKPT